MNITAKTSRTPAGITTDRKISSAPGNLAIPRPSLTWRVDVSGLVQLLRGGVSL